MEKMCIAKIHVRIFVNDWSQSRCYLGWDLRFSNTMALWRIVWASARLYVTPFHPTAYLQKLINGCKLDTILCEVLEHPKLDFQILTAYLKFMNPLRFFELDALFNNTPVENKLRLNTYSYLSDFIGRIFITYGYYQTIQAFRRFGRRWTNYDLENFDLSIWMFNC